MSLPIKIIMAIYFISDGEYIKIGYAYNAHLRLSTMQSGNARKLDIIGMHKGNTKDESRLHRNFKHLHYNGEWFNHSPEILDYITKNKDDSLKQKDYDEYLKRKIPPRPKIPKNKENNDSKKSNIYYNSKGHKKIVVRTVKNFSNHRDGKMTPEEEQEFWKSLH
jgi:hypothetical protein